MYGHLLRTSFIAAVVSLVLPITTRAEPAAGLGVATFRADVTPPLGQPIYSGYKPLATIEHPLLAKGVVLADGEDRFVLCAVDWCELCNSTHSMFRRKIAEAAGTDVSRVAVQTVHQHTAPMGDGDAFRLLDELDAPPPHLPPEFFAQAAERVAAAVARSLDRLESFDAVGTGRAKVERVAASRRVIGPDGEIIIRWSSCRDPALRAMPEGKIDPLLKTVSFFRGEKPLVRLHYYATHPQSFYGDPRASSDFPGMAREALEEREGVFQIYFNGCGGDVTAGKYNDGSPKARNELAARLLAGMEASIAATRREPVDRLGWRTARLKLVPRTEPGYRRADSRAMMLNAGAAPSQRIYAGAMRIAFLDRIDEPIEMGALDIGPARILNLPGESMIEFQLYAQRLLPEALVAVAAYGDCGPAYICTEAAFAEGGYEPSEALLAPETETAMKAAIRELLGVE